MTPGSKTVLLRTASNQARAFITKLRYYANSGLRGERGRGNSVRGEGLEGVKRPPKDKMKEKHQRKSRKERKKERREEEGKNCGERDISTFFWPFCSCPFYLSLALFARRRTGHWDLWLAARTMALAL